MTYAELLIQKGKRGAAAFVQAECNSAKTEPSKSPQHLNALLDHLLNPDKPINDEETIEWCQWLVGGGRSYEDFAANVREYDNTAKCGLVWTADFVAYRCRTCGISQCMSLCAECFKCGNHVGHDYNMFKSQAGGACDCGDSSVMKDTGFCTQHHGVRGAPRSNSPPPDLMCVAENMIPRIILRLLQHLRVNTVHSSERFTSSQALEKYEKTIEEAELFLKLLHDFSSLGAAMRTVMTKALVDMQSYSRLTNVNEDSEYANFMRKSKECYEDALKSLPNLDPPTEFQDCSTLTTQLKHHTFLEELVFWTVKYEFPEKLVCLLLKMLPDVEYKEAFTRSFVLHYSRVSLMLVRSSNSDKLSNRVVHVSVQLFSNESLAFRMTDSLSLLHIMVASLRNMMSGVLVPCQMTDNSSQNQVVDCSKHVMRDHCYWPLVSDLNNVLSHPPIAFRFMSDNSLLTMWFDFLKMFQGMNLNVRVSGAHIEFEPNTYYASFSGELEASASPMWALVSHIRSNASSEYSENILRHCLTALREWMTTIKFDDPDLIDVNKASFHIPLHRYYSVMLRQAVKTQNFCLRDLLPDSETLTLLMQHPLRVQTAFYEIMSGLWVRNGLQIKGQAMTYIQCHFCKSMVDADLFLLQISATHLPTSQFVGRVIESFQIENWLSLSRNRPVNPSKPSRIYRDQDQELQMIESCLIFLVSILSLRTNLGLSEEVLARLEMVSLLCMSDKTHSVLYEHMPEKCGTTVPLGLFDKVLAEVAVFKEPRFETSGSMQQGMYFPQPKVWEDLYDPIYVLLRAVHRREFQTSIERFNTFAREEFKKDPERLRTVASPWPPWRFPPPVDEGFVDPRKLLHSRYMHGLIFNLLHKAVHGKVINDFVTSLAVHLLELTVTFPQKEGFSGKEVAISKPWVMANESVDLKYDTWFPTDWISANLRHVVSVIFSHQTPSGGEENTNKTVTVSDKSQNPNSFAQRMDVDPVSDEEITDPSSVTSSLALDTSTPMEGVTTSTTASPPSLGYNQPLAITGPAAASENYSVVPRNVNPLVSSNPSHPSGSLQITLDAISNNSNRPQSSGNPGEIEAAVTTTMINESIITLLLQLHSKYSGRSDSYLPSDRRSGMSTTKEYRESRIGDACFYIEKVLDRIYEMDESCAQDIESSRQKLWPFYHAQEAQRDQEKERLETEAKRQRAKERQRKMMADFAAQRKRFIEQSEMGVEEADIEETSETSQKRATGKSPSKQTGSFDDTINEKTENIPLEKEYTCCHCLMQGPAKEDRPIGLVTWIQSTSVLAHRYHKYGQLILPTKKEEEGILKGCLEESLGCESYARFHDLVTHFGPKSVLLSVNRSWKGGIHIQSCGHHMHYDCRESYCATLKQQIRSMDTDHGEFICPMCRQSANALLPVPPDPPNIPATVFSRGISEKLNMIATKIRNILDEESVHLAPGPTQLRVQMSRVMEFFTQMTLNQYRLERTNYPNQAVAMFICSIARTNIESDLVQRGGSLVIKKVKEEKEEDEEEEKKKPPKKKNLAAHAQTNKPKFCFVPMMHVLSIHMSAMPTVRLNREWEMLTGVTELSDVTETSLAVKHEQVPLLLQDSITLMLHFILSLPVNIDKAYIETIIQACFNLHLVQIFARLSSGLSQNERSNLKKAFIYVSNTNDKSLAVCMGHVISILESANFYTDGMDSEDLDGLDLNDLEKCAQELALPYLRVASLIRHYFFEAELPLIEEDSLEYLELLKFLELGYVAWSPPASPNFEYHQMSVCKGISFFKPQRLEIGIWCKNFLPFIYQNSMAAKQLLLVNLLWKQPALLHLPRDYDSVFEYYHKRPCRKCQTVPKDPSICLMCGTIVCLKGDCCKINVGETVVGETVRHSQDCGGGTGIFLAVNSSTIVVIRGKKVCIWGSIYLDIFGEEDIDLKRGKPLYLHDGRYELLEHQWLNHKFDHTARKWGIHKNNI